VIFVNSIFIFHMVFLFAHWRFVFSKIRRTVYGMLFMCFWVIGLLSCLVFVQETPKNLFKNLKKLFKPRFSPALTRTHQQRRNHVVKVGDAIFFGLGHYCPSPEKEFRKVYAVCRSLLPPSKSYVKSWGSVQFFFWGGPVPPPNSPVVTHMHTSAE